MFIARMPSVELNLTCRASSLTSVPPRLSTSAENVEASGTIAYPKVSTTPSLFMSVEARWHISLNAGQVNGAPW